MYSFVKKALIVAFLCFGLATLTSCARYGCPANEQKEANMGSSKPGKSTLFPKEYAKKKGIRSR